MWCSGKLCVSNLLTISSGFDVLWVGESLCCCTCVVLRSVPFTRYHLHPPYPAFASHYSVSIKTQCGVISALNVWECVICAFNIRTASVMDVLCPPAVSLSVIILSIVHFSIWHLFSVQISLLPVFLHKASFALNQMFLCSADWPLF